MSGRELAGRAAVLLAAAAAVGAAPELRVGLLEASGPRAAALQQGASEAATALAARGEGAVQLVPLEPASPWRDAAALTARLVFEEGLVALVGPTDGAGAHAAAQIATRRRVPILLLSPEESLTRAFDPWIFRGVPADATQAEAGMRAALLQPRGRRALLALPSGREGRQRGAALRDACRALGVEVAGEVPPAGPDRGAGLAGGGLPPADVLLLWLDPPEALGLLRGPLVGALPGRAVGSIRLDDAGFRTGLPAGGPDLYLPVLRRGEAPEVGGEDPTAALGHDMVMALATAARTAGHDPDRLRQALSAADGFEGRSGRFRFDERGNRQGEIRIAARRDGRWKILPGAAGAAGDPHPAGPPP